MKEGDFCIIANNCWGAEVYKKFNHPFNTPIIGLYFYPDDYLDFISDLRKNLETEVTFIKESRHVKGQEYPVGIVNGIEIHFLHYKSEEEAYAKWTKRCKRVPMEKEKLYFKFDDRDGATADHIHRFHKLNLSHAICFSKDRFVQHANNFTIPMAGHAESVMDGYDQFYVTSDFYSLSDWLKTGNISSSYSQKVNLFKRKIQILLGLK